MYNLVNCTVRLSKAWHHVWRRLQIRHAIAAPMATVANAVPMRTAVRLGPGESHEGTSVTHVCTCDAGKKRA